MLSRILCVGVLSLAAAVASSADKQAGPGPNRADYLDKVSILLDLDAGQKVQLQQMLEEQHEQMKALREQLRGNAQNPDKSTDKDGAQTSGQKRQRPDFQQMHTQRLQAEKELVEKLRPVLTDVQLKKFEVLRELTGPRHGPRRPRPDREQR